MPTMMNVINAGSVEPAASTQGVRKEPSNDRFSRTLEKEKAGASENTRESRQKNEYKHSRHSEHVTENKAVHEEQSINATDRRLDQDVQKNELGREARQSQEANDPVSQVNEQMKEAFDEVPVIDVAPIADHAQRLKDMQTTQIKAIEEELRVLKLNTASDAQSMLLKKGVESSEQGSRTLLPSKFEGHWMAFSSQVMGDSLSQPQLQVGFGGMNGGQGYGSSNTSLGASSMLPAQGQLNAESGEELARGMKEHLLMLVNGRQNSATVQLHPRELGLMKMSIQHHGENVTVAFYVENATTRELVESQLPRLSALLGQNGHQLEDASVADYHQSAQEGSTERHQRDGAMSDRSRSAENIEAADESEVRIILPHQQHDGQVDIYT